MSDTSTFFKNIGKAVGIYVLFNLVFIVLYPLVAEIKIGYFITDYIFKDLTGFVTLLLIPGGGMFSADFFSAFVYYLGDLITYWEPRNHTIWFDIFGLLWVVLPGLITAILMGKFWDERPTKAFWTQFTTIFVLTILPLIFVIFIQINGIYAFSQELMPPTLLTHFYDGSPINWVPTHYLYLPLVGFFNGLFFGGLASLSSTEL